MSDVRDWKVDANRLRSEDCQHVHGEIPQTRKACCPMCLTAALRRAYEAGRADERANREAEAVRV